MTNYTFRNFFENKLVNDKFVEPNIDDWINHLSTLFPQVRLKQFVEIRSMDACSWDLICSQPAFWIGLLYNETSFNKAQEVVESWTQEDRDYINNIAPKEGLQAKFKDGKILDIAQTLLEISKQGLDARNILARNKKYNETFYLKDLENNLSLGKSPADILIDKFKNKWNQNINYIYSEGIF